MPFFSIIMPCYNAQETLGDSIQSVLDQTCSDWELLCVDDGSSDATPRLLKAWAKQDARIRVLPIENRGPAVARNYGASQAKGDIMCFLDADDLWTADKLADLKTLFSDAEIGGAYSVIRFFETVGQEDTRSTVSDAPLSIPQLMGENPVCTMSNFSLRRAHFVKHGGLSQGFVHNEDLEWLIRLVGLGVTIQPVPAAHVWYRKSEAGLSSDLLSMARSRRQALRTAHYFGFEAEACHEARYFRYLARRALRLDYGSTARSFALRGLTKDPVAFLSPAKRGLPTAVGAFVAPILPQPLRRALFT